MADYVLKQEIWVKSFDLDCSTVGAGQRYSKAEFLSKNGRVFLTALPGNVHPFLNSMLKHGFSADLQITFHGREIDEARRLLARGQSCEAIAKALDILERLDK